MLGRKVYSAESIFVGRGISTEAVKQYPIIKIKYCNGIVKSVKLKNKA